MRTDNRRAKEMQGSNIFAIANENVSKKEVSAYKAKEMSGNSGIFGDDGASARASSKISKVPNPPGGRSTITFG